MKASFMAMGDIYLNRDDPKTGFNKITSLLGKADLVFGNLETPLTTRDTASLGRLVPIKTPPAMVEGIKEAGIDIVSLANNHTTDYGPDGLLDTLAILDDKRIQQVGGGRNFKEAHRFKTIEKNGITFGFLAYECTIWSFGADAREQTPGVAKINVSPLLASPHIDEEDVLSMEEDVKKARAKSDVVIVSFHWGVDLSGTVAPHQKKLAYQSIEAGADMVLGHHPHRLQGIEVYRGSLICYSLGNIVFDTVFFFPQTTMIVEALISNKKIEKAYLYPLLIAKSDGELFGPVLPGEGDFKKIVTEIERLSQKFGTKFIRNEDRVEVVLSD